jgi:histone-lysine N-methyltransferase SETMAR
LSDAPKVACVEAAKEMLRILYESEMNDFNGIATSDKSWFHHTTAFLKVFACLAADVIPRKQQAVRAKKYDHSVLTPEKLILLNVLPRGGTCSQLYFINNIVPDSKTANLVFSRQKTGSIFWMHEDNSMCHNGSKVTSKITRNHIFRMPHPLYSPDIGPCDFWFFGMLKQIMKNREFSLNNEITQVWNVLTFDDAQSMFREWIRPLACVTENDGEYTSE